MRLVTMASLGLEGSPLRRARPLLLLTYVRLTGPVRRERAARLLWPHAKDERNSLREALRALRAVDRDLVTEGARGLSSAVACDAHELLAAAAAGDAARVLELVRDTFLADVRLHDVSPEFEEWVDDTRDRIQRATSAAHVRLGREALAAGDAHAALQGLRSALESLGSLGPDEEEARALADLRDGLPPRLRDLAPTLARLRPHRLALVPGIVGRTQETAAALSALARPGSCLQVVGLPGIGKTTLGQLVIRHFATLRRDDPFRWVRLTVRHAAAERLLRDLAAGLGIDGAGSEVDVLRRLSSHADPPDLLVLDLDTTPSAMRATLEPIRAAWPATRWLVLGRRPLDLPSMPAMTLAGLDTRGTPPTDAARLLLQHVDPEIGDGASAVVAERIARSVAGHPLWLRVLGQRAARSGWDSAEAAARDALEDSPSGSIGSDTAALWQATVATLTAAEREAVARLAIADRTWWSRAGLEGRVATETLRDLATLGVTLHGARADTRLHPSLRSACRRRPPVPSRIWARLRDEHARELLGAIADDLDALSSPQQGAALGRMDERFDDLSAAFERIPRLQIDDQRLAAAAAAIEVYCDTRARFTAGIAVCTKALERTAPGSLAHASAALTRAFLRVRAGGGSDHPDVLAVEPALAGVEAANLRTKAANLLGHLALHEGRLEPAHAHFTAALDAAAAAGATKNLPVLMANLAIVDQLRGDLERAEDGYRRSAEAALAAGNQLQSLRSRYNLAQILNQTGRHDQALAALLQLERGVREQRIDALRAPLQTSLAAAYLRGGALDQAYLHASAAVAAAESASDAIQLVHACAQLATVEGARGRRADAGHALLAAVDAAERQGHAVTIDVAVLCGAELLLRDGDASDLAVAWLRALASTSPNAMVRRRAVELCDGHGAVAAAAPATVPDARALASTSDGARLSQVRAFATGLTRPRSHRASDSPPDATPSNSR